MEEREVRGLLERVLDGEPDRFAPLVEAYTPALYNLAHKMFGGSTEASDVVQETFFRAYRDLGRFDGRTRFYSWLCGICVNVSYDAGKRRRRAWEREEPMAEDAEERLAGNSQNAEEELIASQEETRAQGMPRPDSPHAPRRPPAPVPGGPLPPGGGGPAQNRLVGRQDEGPARACPVERMHVEEPGWRCADECRRSPSEDLGRLGSHGGSPSRPEEGSPARRSGFGHHVGAGPSSAAQKARLAKLWDALQRPQVVWAYRMAIFLVLLGIMAGVWRLVEPSPRLNPRATTHPRPGSRVVSHSKGPAGPMIPVTFTFYSPKAQSVCVVSTFNDWDSQKTPMKRGKDGTWTVQVSLPQGRYEYMFLVDGTRYETDPNALELRQDGMGNDNAVLRL